MNYQVKTQQYIGPLDKLLELIEEKHLEITQISLAEVTANFLGYLKELSEQVQPAVLADFLAVAAKLVLIKSRVLLPMLELTKEEEADTKDLEERLKIYREFKAASGCIKEFWDKNKIACPRPFLFALGDQAVFYPPEKLGVSDLVRAVGNLTAALQMFLPDTQKIKKAVLTIEQKIEELLNRIKEAGRQSFRTLVKEKSKEEAIVLFLAVLHLFKDQIIKVEQEKEFGEIAIEKISN